MAQLTKLYKTYKAAILAYVLALLS